VFAKIAKPTPLTDRALMPNAVYHSGFTPMGEMFVVNKSLPTKTLEQLKNRSVGQIEKFLGKESRAFYNEAGDIVIESKDGLRQFRIDLIKTKPHKNPHSHVILYETNKNKKIKLIDERIFPKGVKER
jgi:hypothetical protein